MYLKKLYTYVHVCAFRIGVFVAGVAAVGTAGRRINARKLVRRIASPDGHGGTQSSSRRVVDESFPPGHQARCTARHAVHRTGRHNKTRQHSRPRGRRNGLEIPAALQTFRETPDDPRRQRPSLKTRAPSTPPGFFVFRFLPSPCTRPPSH